MRRPGCNHCRICAWLQPIMPQQYWHATAEAKLDDSALECFPALRSVTGNTWHEESAALENPGDAEHKRVDSNHSLPQGRLH